MATLSQLAGQPVPLKETKDAARAWLTDPTRFLVALFADDHGAEVGAILALVCHDGLAMSVGSSRRLLS